MMKLRLRRRRQLVEHAVDPEADLARVLERLEVDVAGAGAQGLLEDLVDHPDDPAVAARRAGAGRGGGSRRRRRPRRRPPRRPRSNSLGLPPMNASARPGAEEGVELAPRRPTAGRSAGGRAGRSGAGPRRRPAARRARRRPRRASRRGPPPGRSAGRGRASRGGAGPARGRRPSSSGPGRTGAAPGARRRRAAISRSVASPSRTRQPLGDVVVLGPGRRGTPRALAGSSRPRAWRTRRISGVVAGLGRSFIGPPARIVDRAAGPASAASAARRPAAAGRGRGAGDGRSRRGVLGRTGPTTRRRPPSGAATARAGPRPGRPGRAGSVPVERLARRRRPGRR